MYKRIISIMGLTGIYINSWAVPISAEHQMNNAIDVIKPVLKQDAQGFNHLLKDKLNINIESNYFDWEGQDDNSKGSQIFTPITINYRENNIDLGIRSAHISSENKTPNRKGRVTTLSDTNFSFAYTQPIKSSTSIRSSIEWNLPTGKASLSGSQKNAVMDGGLVDQVRFGEGLNLTAGASIVHNFPNQALIGLGYSHTWLGEYDPNLDTLNDDLDPGDQDHITFQAQYRGSQYLVLAGATYTLSDVTQYGNRNYYEKGDRWDTNLTGIYALTDKDRLTLGARYSTQDPDNYVNRITGNFEKESSNVNGDSTYIYGEYAHTLQPNHTIKLNTSFLDIDANSYDYASDYYNAGREKWTYGVGYDWQMTPKLAAKASLKRYDVTDNATLATGKDTDYDGWNGQIGFNYNF